MEIFADIRFMRNIYNFFLSKASSCSSLEYFNLIHRMDSLMSPCPTTHSHPQRLVAIFSAVREDPSSTGPHRILRASPPDPSAQQPPQPPPQPPSLPRRYQPYANFPITNGSPALNPPSTAHPCPLT